MLSRRWIRPIASAKSGATETTVTFAESSTGCVSIESVTIRRPIGLRSRRAIDPSAKTPCVTTAVTERAPRAMSWSAASTSVPALIVKSSTTMASRSATSPMISTISAVSP
jgi:hypothetical protein